MWGTEKSTLNNDKDYSNETGKVKELGNCDSSQGRSVPYLENGEYAKTNKQLAWTGVLAKMGMAKSKNEKMKKYENTQKLTRWCEKSNNNQKLDKIFAIFRLRHFYYLKSFSYF